MLRVLGSGSRVQGSGFRVYAGQGGQDALPISPGLRVWIEGLGLEV